MGIKVIATRQGLYGQFREPGDEFEVADEQAFHESWMEKLDKNGRPIPNKNAPRPARTMGNATGNNPIGAKPRDSMNDLPDDLG